MLVGAPFLLPGPRPHGSSPTNTGDAVCIGTASSTSASSTTTTATATTASSTLEPSTDPSCTKYHKVVDGDSCVGIEQEYGITAAEVRRRKLDAPRLDDTHELISFTDHIASSWHGTRLLDRRVVLSGSATWSALTPLILQLLPPRPLQLRRPRAWSPAPSLTAQSITSSLAGTTARPLKRSMVSPQRRCVLSFHFSTSVSFVAHDYGTN